MTGVQTCALPIYVLDPDPLCICRFSRYVRRVHRSRFAESREEVALASEDYLTLVPTLAVAAQLLLRPSRAQTIAAHAIANYALSARAVGIVRDSWQERQRDAR